MDEAQPSPRPDPTDSLWETAMRAEFGREGDGGHSHRDPSSELWVGGSLGSLAVSGLRAVDNFALVGEIGRGGMGVVLKARDVILERDVAVKLFAGHPTRPEESARFDRECRAIAKLDHPNVVPIYAVGKCGGLRYFAMPLLPGASLAGRLSAMRAAGTRGFPPRDAARIAAGIASALVASHGANVLHRDLKPSNVLFDRTGEPMLIDFGLARDQDRDDPTLSIGFLGTPRYAAPECLSGRSRNDVRLDVFGLGAVLYEMLTLRPPRSGETLSEILAEARDREPLPPRQLDRRVPRDLETICCKALDCDPERRYRTAADVEADLRSFLDHRPIAAKPASGSLRLRRWVRRNPSKATLAGVSIAVLIGMLVWMFAPAGVVVETEPPGAAILVDGADTGSATPARVSAWPAGRHEIRVRLPGYEPQARVAPSEHTTDGSPVRFTLVPVRGFLTVTSPLSGVRVELTRNGVSATMYAPFTDTSVDAGSYTLRASLANYRDRRQDVVVREGTMTRVNVDLEPILVRDIPLDGAAAGGLAAADFDGDGTPDLAVVSRTRPEYGTLSLLDVVSGASGLRIWNRGLGPRDGVSILVLRDFDGDGVPDVALACWSHGRAGDVFVFSGRTGARLWHRVGPTAVLRLEAAGHETDGTPRLVAILQDGSVEGYSVRSDTLVFQRWLSENGKADAISLGWVWDSGDQGPLIAGGWPDGRFRVLRADGSATAIRIGSEPTAVVRPSADCDDVVVGCKDGSVHLLTRGGSRELDRLEGGAVLRLIAVPDRNSDGVSDMLVACGDGSHDVVAMPGGALLARIPAAEAEVAANDAILASSSGGEGDVAFAENTTEGRSRNVGYVRCTSVDGSRTQAFWLQDCIAVGLAAADFDGDGLEDVAVAFANSVSHSMSVKILSFHPRGTLWRFATGGRVWSSPATADFDRDGRPDVVIGSNDGNLYALSGRDGHVLWTVATKGAVWSSPVLADLDEDGMVDVVVGSDDGRLYATSGVDGSLLWPPIDTGGEVSCTPALARVDDDDVPDIVVGSLAGHVHVVSGRTGRELRPPLGPSPSGRNHGFYATPIVRDLDGDGRPEIIAPSFDGKVHVFAGRGGVFCDPLGGGGTMHSSPAWADIDGDGTEELVLGTGTGELCVLRGLRGALKGTRLRCSKINSSPALGDLDGVGVLDVVVGSGCDFDGQDVSAISGADRSELWVYRTGRGTWSTPVLRDVDGDGELDVVVGSADSHLYVLGGRDGALLWRFHIGAETHSRAALADLDGDGVLEAIIGGWDGAVHAVSLSENSLRARRRNLDPCTRALQSLAAFDYSAVIGERDRDPHPSALLRFAAGVARLQRGAERDSLVELRAAAAAGLRAPGLSIHLMSCALIAGEPLDTDVIAAGIAVDPVGFADGMIQQRDFRAKIDVGVERRALEGILRVLPTRTDRERLVFSTVALFAGVTANPPAPDRFEGDPVFADLARILARADESLARTATHTSDQTYTTPGARLVGRIPQEAPALRQLLRMDAR